jgi:uncharacterized protein DUF2478
VGTGDGRSPVARYDNSLHADAGLADCARILKARGYRLGGVVQTPRDRPGRARCDMVPRQLCAGEEISISYDHGNGAKGCRLDLGALAQRRAGWGRPPSRPLDLMIVNKFGKQEAVGRGLLKPTADAIGPGIPMLAGVSWLNQSASAPFAGARAEVSSKSVN